MKTCSTCLHWCGDTAAYAADCGLGLMAKPPFDTDAERCPGYVATGIYDAAPGPTQGVLAAAQAFIAQARRVGPDLMGGDYEAIQRWKDALAAYDAAVRGVTP